MPPSRTLLVCSVLLPLLVLLAACSSNEVVRITPVARPTILPVVTTEPRLVLPTPEPEALQAPPALPTALPEAAPAAPPAPPIDAAGNPLPAAPPPAAEPLSVIVPPFEDRASPAALLASYYNALERREYERAAGYHTDPAQVSLAQLTSDAAGVVSIHVLIVPPVLIQATSDGVLVNVPTYAAATLEDGSQRNLVGCYVLQQQTGAWAVAGGQLALATEPVTPALLAAACPPLQQLTDTITPPFDNAGDPVGLLNSYVNALQRREYERALRYHSDGMVTPEAVAALTELYSGTRSIDLIVIPPNDVSTQGAIQLVELPALLQITGADNQVQFLQGCIGAARYTGDASWRLSALAFQPVPNEALNLRALARVCRP